MKLLFLLEQVEVLELLAHPDDPNPGVGGTSYLIPQLACRLAALWNRDGARRHSVAFGCWQADSPLQHYHGLEVFNLRDPAVAADLQVDLAVATGGALEALAADDFRLNYRRLVAWIHHPFDWQKLAIARRLNAELVSIGMMQYLSHVLIAGRHHQIENLFSDAAIQRVAAGSSMAMSASRGDQAVLRVGYMGALIPSKGFHCILEQWPAIKHVAMERGRSLQMHVIGGSTLYSYQQSHPRLPCERLYGDRLEQLMRLHGVGGQELVFHGVMGPERYGLMASCDVAVVNPDGYGEAFPATILEWLSLGVPPITSGRFGLADVARYLPECTIRGPHQLAAVLARVWDLGRQPGSSLAARCRAVASLYGSKQPLILWQWILLLESLDPECGQAADRRSRWCRPLRSDGYPTLEMVVQLLRDYGDMLCLRLKGRLKARLASRLPWAG